MKTSEVLDKAAELIEREGHWRGDWNVGHRGYCAITAMTTAAHRSAGFEINTYRALYKPAESVLRRAIGGGYIPKWSDNTPTAEVIAMLRAVAMTERAREARMMPVVVRELVMV